MNNILIIGAGINGMLMALALAKKNIHVTLLDRRSFKNKVFDSRTTALAHKVVSVLKEHGLWQTLQAFTTPINNIYVADDYSPSLLIFDNKIVDNQPLGYMIKNEDFRKSLQQAVEENSHIKIIDNCNYNEISFKNNQVVFELENNQQIKPKLAIVAEGKFSNIVKNFFPLQTKKDFQQRAYTFNITHQHKHNNIAVEHFLPSGPFAILPLSDPYQSSIVWTVNEKFYNAYQNLSKNDFFKLVKSKFNQFFGDITEMTEIFSYSLSAHMTKDMYKHNLVLLGDAAHSIHPLAGQGLNLGIYDMDVLINCLNEHFHSNGEISSCLEYYQKTRKIDNYMMLNITNFINKIFMVEQGFISKARKKSLGFLNNRDFVKKFLMKYAMGLR